jgi:hypothetical protein
MSRNCWRAASSAWGSRSAQQRLRPQSWPRRAGARPAKVVPELVSLLSGVTDESVAGVWQPEARRVEFDARPISPQVELDPIAAWTSKACGAGRLRTGTR